MIRAACFDLDGTLIDSTEAIVESFFHTFDVIGEPRPAREAVVTSIGHILEDQFAMLTARDPGECAAIYREHYGKICLDKTFLLPGAAELLAKLAETGLPIGFATSKRRTYAEHILEHLGVLGRFSVRIGPEDVTHPKPAPEALLKAAEGFGFAPAEMVFVGDTHFDVLAARAAGMPCVCVTIGYATREALESLGPEAVYDTLGEVGEHILRNL
jgi:phosphoglycolate phosphatase